MRVLLVTHAFPPALGGMPTVYWNLARLLSPEIAILTAQRDYRTREEVAGWREFDQSLPFLVKRVQFLQTVTRGKGPRPLRVLEGVLQDLLITRTKVAIVLLKLLREIEPDIVCIGSLHASYWILKIIKLWRDIPVIAYVHGEEIGSLFQRRIYGKGPLTALRNADAVVSVSSFTRSILIRHGIDPAKIHLVHNGVDLKRFTPGLKDADLIARYGLQDKHLLLTVGRLDERKGHDIAIRAMSKVLSVFPNTVYFVVGEGEQRSSLEGLIRELDLSRHVFIRGSVTDDELLRWYRTCDLFLMPNRTLADGDTEGFGLVFLEAGGCTKPVIGGAAGGVPDAIEDGVTGLLVEGTSVDAVANAIIRLLSDSDLANRMGANGLRKAQEHSWDSQAAQFRAICASLIADQRRSVTR